MSAQRAPRLEPPCAVRHIDGRTGLLLQINAEPNPPLGLVRWGRAEPNGEGALSDTWLPLGYLERVGSKDMD